MIDARIAIATGQHTKIKPKKEEKKSKKSKKADD